MKLVFFWNYLNHHQVHIADELYNLLGNEFAFVVTLPRKVNELKGGNDYSSRPYCLLAGEDTTAEEKAIQLAQVADVCVFGGDSQKYAIIRAKQENCRLSFECGERWLKRGYLNILSHVLRVWWINYMCYYRKKPFYKLCSSAFTAADDERLLVYKNRHFKWGYFTEVKELEDFKTNNLKLENSNLIVRLMWCARFIDWKHPEMAVELAKRIKTDGYKFQLDMYGDGVMRPVIENMITYYNLSDCVCLKGNVPNKIIQQAMQSSDIFLFTSDRREGWGAVANEAMSNKCCLIGSDEIGSIPFLVKDRVTGMIFKSKSVDSLYEKLKYLLDNPHERKKMEMGGVSKSVKHMEP